MSLSPGKRFKLATQKEQPLKLVGTINAYTALLAEQTGFHAIYLSGAGVANASYGLPDIGMTHATDVCIDIQRITQVTDLPLMVDIDTGWGSFFNIERTIRQVESSGAAAVHIEDQVQAKRCGHRPNKSIVNSQEMVDRIKAAVGAKQDADFVVMARTDALANEGINAAIDRACAYVEAGADMVFPEAMITLEHYQQFIDAVKVPVLANITEFGKTPLFSCDELASVGVSIALYPLSAFRAMNQAALNVYRTIFEEGSQSSVVDSMQTREALYKTLNYHDYEDKLDQVLKGES